MTLRNAFWGLATEDKQDNLNGIADSLLEAAQALQAAVDALNAKTVAVDTGAVTIANQPAQPLTDTQLRAADVPVTLGDELSGIAHEETLRDLQVDIPDIYMRALLRKLIQLKFGAGSDLSVSVASLPTLATLTTLTTGNVGLGDAGKPASYQQISAISGNMSRRCFVWE